ncbi:HdaA/DnaA family protein [Pseudorhodoferax sp.]|jgi:DnaA family protein|uniref:HdaA/DnaA family protein n=1 Tax=Pseudorhodoferax sp. TaxID=1993553 RepID=UPI001B5D8D07|nr:DnaA regulatory inactivator Hda [Pseudorhodoferax sp.]MBP8144169.1 DnaA regulatory inactivator Hda [Inhella sp.]
MGLRQFTLDLGPEPDQRFERFIEGANGLLLAHLLGLRPGDAPTLLSGAAGSGKTHLLRALGALWQAQGLVVQAFDAATMAPWTLSAQARLVLLDDVDRFDADQQQAAFGLFIEAVGQGAAVVAASRLPAAELSLREDLRTRLAWGPGFALQPLGDAALRQLLRDEGAHRGLLLPDELLDHLLLRFERDTNHLLPLLQQLDRYAMRTKRAPSVPLLREMLMNERDATTTDPV